MSAETVDGSTTDSTSEMTLSSSSTPSLKVGLSMPRLLSAGITTLLSPCRLMKLRSLLRFSLVTPTSSNDFLVVSGGTFSEWSMML